MPRYITDTGIHLPPTKFIDEKGKTRTLADFKGKILYVDVWATDCAPCIARMPHAEQLAKRLKATSLDTSIQMINICSGESKEEWKKMLAKHHPVGINLYSIDTSFDRKWKITAVPHYILLDKEGKVMSKKFSAPDEGGLDYMLYAATKKIKPAQAVWMDFRQYQSFRKNQRFTDDEEGRDYAEWYKVNSVLQVAYFQWRTSRNKKR